MRKSKVLSSFLYIFIVLFVLSFSLFNNFSQQVRAANLTSENDVLTRIKASTLSSHDITFTLGGSTAWNAGETIAIDFNEDGGGFSVNGASSTTADFDINDGTERTVFNVGTSTDCTGSSGANDVSIGINDTTGVVTLLACPSFTASGNGATVNVEYGTAATGGTNRVTNPSSANTYIVTITAAGDSGSYAVDILSEDQVTISASVNPTLDVTLSATTCALATLSSSQIDTCSYTVTVSTNATSGYASTILDDGNLRDGSNDINDAAGDNDVDQGSEEYGVATSDTSQTIVTYTTCTDPASNPQAASAMTTSAQQFANATGPVSGDVTTLCHAASITGSTPAGSFSHVATIIVTATF